MINSLSKHFTMIKLLYRFMALSLTMQREEDSDVEGDVDEGEGRRQGFITAQERIVFVWHSDTWGFDQ